MAVAPGAQRRIVAIPDQPGESIDRRILGDVEWIVKTFKVKVTDGFSTSTIHAAGGEHPVGLAVDVVPDTAKGGTWDDVDRLVAFAQKHPETFRWIGYNGVPGHGRGNHAHLSWRGRTGEVKPLKPDAKGGITGAVTGAAGAVGNAAGDVVGAVKDAPGDLAGAIVSSLWDAVAKDAAKAGLYVLLVGGGVALVVMGVNNALGGAPARAAKGAAKTTAEVAAVMPK